MKRRTGVSEKVIEHFKNRPHADVKATAKRFKIALPKAYVLRKQALEKPVAAPKKAKPEVIPAVTVNVSENDAKVSVDQILDQRAANYGKFIEGAEIMQMLKRMVHNYIEQRGTSLAFDQLEAIDMIIHKLGRIINGNPDHTDNWKDIAGYSTLVADRLEGTAR